MAPHLQGQSVTNSGTAEKLESPYSLDGSLRKPAVSEINAKASYEGGSMDSSEGHNFQASVTLPVAEQFGLQVDGAYSRIGGDDFAGGAGHAFWRDPDLGFLGVAGGGLHRDGVNTFQIGAEGGWYVGSFTFGFFAGAGTIDYDNSAPFIDTNPADFIGRLSVDWYALEDLRLGVSGSTAFQNYLVKADLEYQTPISGLALTGEIATGDHDYDHWLLGIRYYFGAKKSLRDRQRQDDPPGLMPQILQGLGLYGAEVNQKGSAYYAANPSAGMWNSSGGFEVSRIRNTGSVTGGDFPPPPPGPLDPGGQPQF